MHRFLIGWIACCFLGTLLSLSSCADPLDLTRPEFDRGTLGQELYRIFLKDLQRSSHQAQAKADAFRSYEGEFIWAVDTIVPPDQTDALQTLLLAILPLWDDDTLPDLVRKVGFILDDAASSDEVLEAWIRTDQQRDGYVHDEAFASLLDRIANYPRLRDLAVFGTDLVLDYDGVDASDELAGDPNDFVARLLTSLVDHLRQPEDPADLTRTIALLADLLLQFDARFALTSTRRPAWAVRLDARGLAAPGITTSGRLHSLFADDDLDGLADIDSDGWFLGPSGQPFVLPPYGEAYDAWEVLPGVNVFRDDLGRARDAGGQLIFQYVDLSQTPIGYVIRRVPELVREKVITDLTVGLDGVLGDLDRSGDYPTFTASTPLLDLSDALFQALDFHGLPELAEVLALLLSEHEDTVATLLLVLENAADIVDTLDPRMEPDNALLDDVLVYLYPLMQHEGLIEALLTGLQDPVFGRLFEAMDDLMAHYNPHVSPEPNGSYLTAAADCLERYDAGTWDRYDCLRATPREEIFTGPADHATTSGPASISLSQRLMHLIYVASNTPFEMVIEAITLGQDGSPIAEDIGPLILVPDTAAAFFDSVVGNFCLVDYVNMDLFEQDESLAALVQLAEFLGVTEDEEDFANLVVGIIVAMSDDLGVHLDECPTAAQTIRYYNLPEYNLSLGPVWVWLEPPIDGEGFIFSENVVDSLFAAEAVGALEALYPLLKPLSDRELTALAGELVAAMYRHYPEPTQSYRIADGSWADLEYSGLRRYEPSLIRIFRDGRLMQIVQEFAEVAQQLDLWEDSSFSETLRTFAEHLLEPAQGLHNRRGEVTATRGDGVETPMTRFYLLTEAMDAIQNALDTHPEADQAWENAVEKLVDLLLDVLEDDRGRGRFEDPGSAALGTVFARHAAYHLRRQRVGGELHTHFSADYPQFFEDMLTSRGFAAAIELMREVRSDPDDLALFDDIVLYLTEENQALPAVGLNLLYTLLFFATDQFGYVRVAPLLADIVDPQRSFEVTSTPNVPFVTHAAMLLARMLELDGEDAGLDLFRRAVSESAQGDIPLNTLARVVRDIHRQSAGSSDPLTADDLRALIGAVVDFIRNDTRGLERMFDLVQERSGPRHTIQP